MKSGKKIIILSITIIIIILCVIFTILYLATDVFKSNQQLFYKYISQIKIIDKNFIEKCTTTNKLIDEKNNLSNMEIKVINLKENTETQISNIQEIFTINSNGLHNSLLNQSYRDFVFSKNNQTFLTLKCLKDNNTYGIIADNILAKYLSVDNINLRELLSKLGKNDASMVPDSISVDYDDVLKFDNEVYKKIKDNYFTLINENINKNNFYKVKKEDKTETIGVSLTEQEFINIAILLLNNAKNDETLLDVINDKLQLLNYKDVNIEKIQSYIQKNIDEFNNNTYSNENDYFKLSFILKDKKVMNMNIEKYYYNEENVTHKIIYELDLSKDYNIGLVVKEDETEIYNIKIEWNYDDNKINISLIIKVCENEKVNTINIIYQISNLETSDIKQNSNIYFISDDEQYQISFENDIILKEDVQISKLTTENSVKINEMTTEEINQIIDALINRINELYQIDLKDIFNEYITIH